MSRKTIKKSLFDSIETKYFVYFFLILQSLLWFFWTKNIKPNFTITPLPPSKLEVALFNFGDKQLLYRIYAFQLQNAGDTFGETIPLKNYDYEKLEKWFYAISELDSNSEYVPSIAGFYYAQSQNPKDNEYIVYYLNDIADKNPKKFWRWYTYAAYLANHKLHNLDLSVEIAKKIIDINNSDIPVWAKTMAIFASSKTTDDCRTLKLIAHLMQDGSFESLLTDKIYGANAGEHNFLFKIIEKRIEDIKKDKSILNKCIDEDRKLKNK